MRAALDFIFKRRNPRIQQKTSSRHAMVSVHKLFACARAAYRTPTSECTKESLFSAVSNVREVHMYDASLLGNSSSDAQYYSLELEDCLVFAIRGTSSWEDALADVEFFQAPFQDIVYSACAYRTASPTTTSTATTRELAENVFEQRITAGSTQNPAQPSADSSARASSALAAHRAFSRVHVGFLKQYNSIKFSIFFTIFRAMSKRETPQRVIFVGHSLGGALATLAAAGTKALFPQVMVQCTTFGSPRVGNAAFAAYFDAVVDCSERYVNASDKVPKNPTLGYAHVGGEVRIGAQNPGWFVGFFGSVQDHSLDSYETSLKTMYAVFPGSNNV